MFRRFSSLLFALFIVFLNVPPAFADGGLVAPLGEIASFVDWGIDKVYWLFGRTTASLFDEDICVGKDAGMSAHHHFVKMNTSVGGQQGIYYVCEYCGKEAGEVLEAAESEYVETLPATTVTSDGGFLWYPTVDNLKNNYIYTYNVARRDYQIGSQSDNYSWSYYISSNYGSTYCNLQNDRRSFKSYYPISGSLTNCTLGYGNEVFVAPVRGTYYMQDSVLISGDYSFLINGSDLGLVGSGGEVRMPSYNAKFNLTGPFTVYYYFPSFVVVPSTPYNVTSTSDNDTYNIGTRAASITGNYGIVNSNGTVSQIESQTIVNEGDHSVYNPVTNETENFDDWTYDYSTRTYTLTEEEGDTTTVTYGDEYITYSSGGNTTNIYYITNASDSGNGGDSGSGSGGNDTPAHTHSYTSEITTAPTCTRSGVRTYTCSCGASYTEAIPATGHAWEVVTNRLTQYSSSEGVLLEAGFTIYECSVCGQQYRTDDESLPPGIIGQNTDLMEIGDNGQSLVSSMSGMYEGYLALLAATFPYLPEEIRKLLYFGLTSVVSIGIYKGIRR